MLGVMESGILGYACLISTRRTMMKSAKLYRECKSRIWGLTHGFEKEVGRCINIDQGTIRKLCTCTTWLCFASHRSEFSPSAIKALAYLPLFLLGSSSPRQIVSVTFRGRIQESIFTS